MKKGIVISGFIISVIIIGIGIYGFVINYLKKDNKDLIETKITLEQITNQFNNSSTVKEYSIQGSIWKATQNANKLNISLTVGTETSNIEYILNGDILSGNFTGNDAITGAIVSLVLTDCIGQLHGYSDGALFNTLNSEQIKNYTLEKEGLKVEQPSDGNFQIKININKKIPLADFSNVYITVEDLEAMKDNISGDGSAEKNKGNIWFNKSGYNNEYTLLIGEKNTLTKNTYNSIISILTVMFNNDKIINYFNENYSDISVGNKQFEGFNIMIDPTDLTDFEENLLEPSSGYKFMKIIIDVNAVNSIVNR